MGLLMLTLFSAMSFAQESTPIAAKVRDAMTAGDCEQARAIAAERVQIVPDDAHAHRLLGDAYRCLTQSREAVLAYRKAQTLGINDAVLRQLVDKLSASLASLQVRVDGVDWANPPTFSLKMASETLEPASWNAAVGVVFQDLAAGVPLEFRMAGPGYDPLAQSMPGLAAGEHAQASAHAEYRGLGTLEIAPWQGSYVVSVIDSFRRREAVEPGSFRVNAGDVVVTVQGQTGTGQRTLAIGKGQVQALDVSSLLPAQVTLIQVPVGSTLSLGLSDGGVQRVIEVGWPEAPLDPDVGLPVVAAFPLKDLSTGSYAYDLKQPWLGVVHGEFFAVGGEVGAHKVAWQQAPGVESLSAAYKAYLTQVDAQKGPSKHAVLGGVGAGLSAVLAGGTALALVKAIQAQSRAGDMNEAYEQALLDGDTENANLYYQDRADARDAARLGWIGSGAGVVLTGSGLFFSVEMFKKGKAEKGEAPVWDVRALPSLLPVEEEGGAVGE